MEFLKNLVLLQSPIKYYLALTIFLTVPYQIFKYCKSLLTQQDLLRRAGGIRLTTRAKFIDVLNQLQNFSLEPQLSKKVLKSNISELHELLFQKKLTCVDLLRFFTKRSLEYEIIHQPGLVVGVVYERALKLAKEKDTQLFTKYSKIEDLPPLFGIPISLKESFILNGENCTLGSATLADKKYSGDGLCIRMILQAGGIPFIRTNLPQLLFVNETNNWIWGRAKNPWNQSRSAGGSSGGEGGVIAVRNSPLGLGSDGAGSIRIPALSCGIVGIRPTSRRFVFKGHARVSRNARVNIHPSIGPMSTNVADCTRMLEALSNLDLLKMEDPLRPRLAWKKEKVLEFEKKKLRIGILRKIDLFAVCESNKRAIQISVQKLREAGHTIVEFEPEQILLKNLCFSLFK